MKSRITADGGKGFAWGVLSMAGLRLFCARHRDLTFRPHESKEGTKMQAKKRSRSNYVSTLSRKWEIHTVAYYPISTESVT